MYIFTIPFNGKCKVPGAELGAIELIKNFTFEKKKDCEINILSDFENYDKKMKISKKICSLLNRKKVPIILGGDHSTTSYIFNNILNTDFKYGCIIFDAHNDYAGTNIFQYYNWNVINCIKEFISEGVLIGYRDKYVSMPKCDKFKYIEDYIWDFKEEVVKSIEGLCKHNEYIYVSIDLDVLNPCEFPGTGYQCAGGIFLRELIYFIKVIKKVAKNLIIDIVEFNPLIEKEQSLRVIKRLINEISL